MAPSRTRTNSAVDRDKAVVMQRIFEGLPIMFRWSKEALRTCRVSGLSTEAMTGTLGPRSNNFETA